MRWFIRRISCAGVPFAQALTPKLKLRLSTVLTTAAGGTIRPYRRAIRAPRCDSFPSTPAVPLALRPGVVAWVSRCFAPVDCDVVFLRKSFATSFATGWQKQSPQEDDEVAAQRATDPAILLFETQATTPGPTAEC